MDLMHVSTAISDLVFKRVVILARYFWSYIRTITIIAILGFLFCGLCHADEIELKASKNVVKTMELVGFSLLADGGTMGFIFKDEKGEIVKFCFDGRVKSSTRGELFVGDTHPANAQLVLKNSEESAKLLYILEEYVLSKLKNKKINADNVLSDEERVAGTIDERIKRYKKEKDPGSGLGQ